MGMGKFFAIAAVIAVTAITAMQSLGDDLESSFAEQATQDAGYSTNYTSTEITTATAEAAPVEPIKPAKPADLDGADKMIAVAINLNGYLCARPVEVREVSTNLYGVQCITNRDGSGISNYLVNSRTNEVTPI